jgi:hypothetical protein
MQQPGRGALVDRCWKCGTLLRRASPEQHSALQMALEDVALQLLWPTPEVLERFPHSGPPMLRGVSWWWQKFIQAYDRMKHEEDFELSPAIDGIGFDGRGLDMVRGPRLRRSLNDVEISSIIEYVNAFGAERGVKRRRPAKKTEEATA